MVKSLLSWSLLVVGGLLATATLSMICVLLYREIRLRIAPRGMINMVDAAPVYGSDFVIHDIPFRTKPFVTTIWVELIALLAAALLLVAVGLHLRHLHRMDVGREHLEQKQMEMNGHGQNAS
jgi:hypothetical protein